MNFEVTISILAGAIILAALSFFMARRPKDIGKPWTVPWHGVMFLSVLTALLMINHIASLNKAAETPLF